MHTCAALREGRDVWGHTYMCKSNILVWHILSINTTEWCNLMLIKRLSFTWTISTLTYVWIYSLVMGGAWRITGSCGRWADAWCLLPSHHSARTAWFQPSALAVFKYWQPCFSLQLLPFADCLHDTVCSSLPSPPFHLSASLPILRSKLGRDDLAFAQVGK